MMKSNYAPDAKAIAEREKQLEEYGHNVFTMPPDLIKYEFKTDSWIEILTGPLIERLSDLQSKVDYQDRKDYSADIFSFKYFVYVAQGRSAEAYYWKVDNKKDKQVVTNVLFPTTRQHIIMNRMTPVECPVAHVFDDASEDVFRGNLDCATLRNKLQEDAKSIAYIYIEAENNASGGYAVSISNLKEVRNIINDYDIKMVLDSTRLIENCVMIQKFEAGYQDKSVLEIAREFSSYFDSMTNSLAKDFGIDRGGIIGTNDERLHYRVKDVVAFYGPGISITDKAMINAAMKDWDFIENMARRRVDQASRIFDAFIDNNLPVISPAGGHCVLIDIEKYFDVSPYKNAVATFIAYIYAQSGVRGGAHLSGMLKQYCKSSYVRFAIPLCMSDEAVDAMTVALVHALTNLPVLPDLEKTSSLPGLAGMLNARFKLAPLCLADGSAKSEAHI